MGERDVVLDFVCNQIKLAIEAYAGRSFAPSEELREQERVHGWNKEDEKVVALATLKLIRRYHKDHLKDDYRRPNWIPKEEIEKTAAEIVETLKQMK